MYFFKSVLPERLSLKEVGSRRSPQVVSGELIGYGQGEALDGSKPASRVWPIVPEFWSSAVGEG